MTDDSNIDDDDLSGSDDDLSGSFEDFMGDDEIDDDDVTDFLSDDDEPAEQFAALGGDVDDEDVMDFLSDESGPHAAPVAADMDDDDVADFLTDDDDAVDEIAVSDDDDAFSDSDVEVAEIPLPAHGTLQSPFYRDPDSLPVAAAASDVDDDDDDAEIIDEATDDEFDFEEFDEDDAVIEVATDDRATQMYTDSIESDAVSGAGGEDIDELSDDEWVTGSHDTLNHTQAGYESDLGPTVLSDMPMDDPEYSQSMGRPGTLGPDDRFPDEPSSGGGGTSQSPATETIGADEAAAGISSRIWGASSKDGFGSSLAVRERPVSGHEAPFSVQEDADYEVIEELARGGMGVVYIARQTSLDRMLAIKTLRLPDDGGSSGHSSRITRLQRECFLSEALVTANLVHPNIVPIHDLCQTKDGIPFYSMKRVTGSPWVSSAGPSGRTAEDIASDPIRTMSLAENLEVLLKVCDGVAYAHSQGVVNRDLKPENVIIGDFGEVIVLDWGLAVFTPDSGRQNSSSATASFGAGTAAYMAPELWTGPGEAIGRWSDIYLLGGMLFEIMTGHAPHKFEIPKNMPANPTPTERQRMKIEQINEVVGRNRIRETDQKGELFDIAMKALQTRPEDRFKSVQEFQAAIRDYQRHEESRHLARRADQLMAGKTGSSSEGYEDYQTAAALYEESLRNWDGNKAAAQGLFDARLNNAKLAYKRGDYDLGLQLVAHNPDAKEYVAVRNKLQKAKKRRGAQKWTMAALMGTIMIGGPVAAGKFYLDNKALNEAGIEIKTAKATAAAEQEKAVAAQEAAKIETEKATIAKAEASTATAAAATAKSEAERALTEANNAKVELAKVEDDKRKVAIDLMMARMEEATAKQAAKAAEEAVELAKEAVRVANEERMNLEKEKQRIEAEKNIAEREQKVASFEVKMQKATSDTVSMNLTDAKRGIEALLKSDELNALDETSKAQRINELNAQKEQLERLLSVPTETPVQTQRLSPDGTFVAWLHAPTGENSGRISVRSVDSGTGQPANKAAHEWTLDTGAFADAAFVAGQTAIVCVHDRTLTLWNYAEDSKRDIATGTQKFTTLELNGDTIITATQNGLLTAWRLDGSKAWTYDADTEVRDLTMLPSQNVLICAGSRADTSANVLALRIADDGAHRLKPNPQLTFTRDSNSPPQVLAVSPRNAELMVVGNSRNGSILILPRNESTDKFPFQSPTELQKTGSREWIQSKHRRPVNAIAFSADGSRFATASDDRTIGIWKVRNAGAGQLSVLWESDLQLQGHGAAVTDVAFLDTAGQRLLSTSRDRSSRVWNLETYVEDLQRILNTTKSDPATAASDDPEPPVTETPVSVRNVRSKQSYLLTGHRPLQSDTADDPAFIVLNQSSQPKGTMEILRGGIRSVDMTADGSRIVTGGADGTAVLWDATSGHPVRGESQEVSFHRRSRLFEEGHKFNVSQLMFLPPDQHICLSTSFDGSLCLWQADPLAGDFGTEKNRLTGLRLVNAVAAAPNGTFIVTSAFEEEQDTDRTNFPCRIWNVAQLLTGATPPTDGVVLNGFHRDIVTAITVSDDSLTVATGSKDGYVALWNTADGKLLASVRAHDEKSLVTGMAWLGANQLLTVGVDGEIRSWDVSLSTTGETATMKLADSYQGDVRSPIDRLAVSPDRQQFLTLHATFLKSSDEAVYEVKVRRIDEKRGRAIRLAAVADKHSWTVKGNKASSAGLVSSIAWSADGSQAAIVAGGQINILNTETWTLAKVFRSRSESTDTHITAAVFPSALSKATNRSLIATFDGTAAQLWDMDSGQLVTTFQPQRSVNVSALSTDPEHRFLATGSASIRIFNSAETDPGYAQTLSKASNPHVGGVTALTFSPDSKQLASGGQDGVVKVWDWDSTTGKLTTTLTHDAQQGRIADVKWSSDGSTLLVVAEKQAAVYDIATQTPTPLSAQTANNATILFRCGDFRQDGSAVVLAGRSEDTGGSIGLIFQKDPADGTFVYRSTFEGHGAGGISCVEFVETPGSPYLVSGGTDGAAIVWNWSGQTPYQAYRFLSPNLPGVAHRAAVTDLAVASSGTIATCSDDGTAIIWKNPLALTADAL
ncbi:MAG: WD40 repeat domain-containing serine/threonine-protein kinase [Planctomycetaceae bacterium]